MRKLTKKEIAKPKPNPIFDSLPEVLKEPSNYARIEKRLLDAMHSDHTHKTVKQFVKCARCKGKLAKRQQIMKEEGFTSIGQYLEWKRVLSIIIGGQDIQLT